MTNPSPGADAIDAFSAQDPLQAGIFDLLVIGGGIVGAGVARDAAMRGLRTALVEQHDFASGTSSRSTRLLHGGIRYLAQGRIGLVREANLEKTVVQRIAPHLALPLPFIFPTREGTGLPLWKLRIGVKLYDLLCGRRKFGRSSALTAVETIEAVPGLAKPGLKGSVRYFDGLTNDARLVLDTLQSASHHGAVLQNYLQFVDAQPKEGIWHAQLQQDLAACRLEEDRPRRRSVAVKTRCVVNATGPWSDRIPGAQTSLRLTKGVHLVVDGTRLPVSEAVVAVEGDRILFLIPWGERVILGTTDTDYHGPLDEPECDRDDMQYVLDAINSNFPEVRLTERDVISAWAGLRPLVADKRGAPSDISRRHQITMSRPGWWDVTGGKLTTYRLMAEETVDALHRYLGVSARRCETAEVELLADVATSPPCGVLPPPVSAELVRRFCRREWAWHLDDVMIRRTSWRYYHVDHLAIAEQVALWMQAELHWDAKRLGAELERYRSGTDLADLHAAQISRSRGAVGEGEKPNL